MLRTILLVILVGAVGLAFIYFVPKYLVNHNIKEDHIKAIMLFATFVFILSEIFILILYDDSIHIHTHNWVQVLYERSDVSTQEITDQAVYTVLPDKQGSTLTYKSKTKDYLATYDAVKHTISSIDYTSDDKEEVSVPATSDDAIKLVNDAWITMIMTDKDVKPLPVTDNGVKVYSTSIGNSIYYFDFNDKHRLSTLAITDLEDGAPVRNHYYKFIYDREDIKYEEETNG